MNVTLLGANYPYAYGTFGGAGELLFPLSPTEQEMQATGKLVINAQAAQTQSGSALSSLSAEGQKWFSLILDKGLPYYESYKNTEVGKTESAGMNEAFQWMLDKGVIVKSGDGMQQYIPWIIGGVVILALLGTTGLLVQRRRRRRA